MTRFENFRTAFVTLLLSLATVFATTNDAKAQNGYVDFDVFYNELSPYGNWFDHPEYGYVWQPRGIQNFQPYYTNGYWVMTEYGNTWVSNYNWGWAPFHYGRWTMSRIGWVWIPGTQWGPAWVDWRQGNGYYGWAPMGPNIQININVSRWNTPMDWFVFVPYGNIYNRNFGWYNRPGNFINIYQNTTIINNFYNDRGNRPIYNYGPRRNDIARHLNRNVPVYRVTNSPTRRANAAPRGNRLAIYRPEVRNTNTNAAPRNVRTLEGSTSRGNNVDANNSRNTPAYRNTNNGTSRMQTPGSTAPAQRSTRQTPDANAPRSNNNMNRTNGGSPQNVAPVQRQRTPTQPANSQPNSRGGVNTNPSTNSRQVAPTQRPNTAAPAPAVQQRSTPAVRSQQPTQRTPSASSNGSNSQQRGSTAAPAPSRAQSASRSQNVNRANSSNTRSQATPAPQTQNSNRGGGNTTRERR